MGQLNLQIVSSRDDQTLKKTFETPSSSAKHSIVQQIINFISGLGSGTELGPSGSAPSIGINIEGQAVAASGTITVSAGGSANDETCVICGVTFTAKTSGATGNQFNISATAATQATNIANAINGSSDLEGICTAEANSGVVTVTAAKKGVIGNGLVMADVDLANTVIVSFADGADDATALTLNF